jgi:hypothetical protein
MLVHVSQGEGGPSEGNGVAAGSLTSELVNLDMLGSFASSGVELFARQQLPYTYRLGDDHNGPVSAQFWCSILFKKLMGTSVLNVSTSTSSTGAGAAGQQQHQNLVRAYAHSTPAAFRGRDGRSHVTLMLLNFNNISVEVSPSFAAAAGGGSRPSCLAAGSRTARRFTLEAAAAAGRTSNIVGYSAVLLNGKRLEFANNKTATLPPMVGIASGCGSPQRLPPLSVTWLVV